MELINIKGKRENLAVRADTLEPDLRRVTPTWHIARPRQKNLRESAQVLVRRKVREWRQACDRVAFPDCIVVELLVAYQAGE